MACLIMTGCHIGIGVLLSNILMYTSRPWATKMKVRQAGVPVHQAGLLLLPVLSFWTSAAYFPGNSAIFASWPTAVPVSSLKPLGGQGRGCGEQPERQQSPPSHPSEPCPASTVSLSSLPKQGLLRKTGCVCVYGERGPLQCLLWT